MDKCSEMNQSKTEKKRRDRSERGKANLPEDSTFYKEKKSIDPQQANPVHKGDLPLSDNEGEEVATFFDCINEASYKTRLRYVSMSTELIENAIENTKNKIFFEISPRFFVDMPTPANEADLYPFI